MILQVTNHLLDSLAIDLPRALSLHPQSHRTQASAALEPTRTSPRSSARSRDIRTQGLRIRDLDVALEVVADSDVHAVLRGHREELSEESVTANVENRAERRRRVTEMTSSRDTFTLPPPSTHGSNFCLTGSSGPCNGRRRLRPSSPTSWPSLQVMPGPLAVVTPMQCLPCNDCSAASQCAAARGR